MGVVVGSELFGGAVGCAWYERQRETSGGKKTKDSSRIATRLSSQLGGSDTACRIESLSLHSHKQGKLEEIRNQGGDAAIH